MHRTTQIALRIGLTLSVIAAAIWLFSGWGWPHHAWNGNYTYGFGHRGWMPYGMMGGGMGPFSGVGLVMILFWVIVLVLMGSLISGIWSGQGAERSENTTCTPARTEPDALEILKRRYARGDIDQAEYERMKRVLA